MFFSHFLFLYICFYSLLTYLSNFSLTKEVLAIIVQTYARQSVSQFLYSFYWSQLSSSSGCSYSHVHIFPHTSQLILYDINAMIVRQNIVEYSILTSLVVKSHKVFPLLFLPSRLSRFGLHEIIDTFLKIQFWHLKSKQWGESGRKTVG